MLSMISAPVRMAGAVAAVALSFVLAPAASAQTCGNLPCSFEGTTTQANNVNATLASNSDFMISYRDEQHSWQTPDGVTHFLINMGQGAGGGLRIWSRYVDHSNTEFWVAGPSIPNSSSTSTADGRLVTNSDSTQSLAIVYSTTLNGSAPSGNNAYTGGNIHYMLLDYSGTTTATTTGWTLDNTVSHSTALQNVFTTPQGFYATNPTMAIDTTSAAVTWVAYTISQCPYYNSSSPATTNCLPTTTIKLSYLGTVNNNTKWVDTGLNFGPTDGNYVSEERTARLISTANAVGMIYQVHQSFFWTYRINGNQPNSAWAAPQAVFTSAPNPGTSDPAALYDNNPYASHFSAVADTDNPNYSPGGSEAKIHMVTVDHSRMLYFGYSAAQTSGWSSPTIIMTSTEGIGTPNQVTGATYPQIFFAPNTYSSPAANKQYMGALVNNSTVGNLFQSTDFGQTWTPAAILKHDNVSNNLSFLNPRFEVPQAISTTYIPLVQQYVDPNAQQGVSNNYLLFFDLQGLVN